MTTEEGNHELSHIYDDVIYQDNHTEEAIHVGIAKVSTGKFIYGYDIRDL